MDTTDSKTLEDIKWLLVLQLQNQGISSKDIAQVIGVDPSIISRKVPRRKNNKSKAEDK